MYAYASWMESCYITTTFHTPKSSCKHMKWSTTSSLKYMWPAEQKPANSAHSLIISPVTKEWTAKVSAFYDVVLEL